VSALPVNTSHVTEPRTCFILATIWPLTPNRSMHNRH